MIKAIKKPAEKKMNLCGKQLKFLDFFQSITLGNFELDVFFSTESHPAR